MNTWGNKKNFTIEMKGYFVCKKKFTIMFFDKSKEKMCRSLLIC
jgi:hypothetical protein